MISRCTKCVTSYHSNCMFEVVEQDGNLSRIAHVSIIPVSPKHFMCLKHQKEGESRQDEGKKLPLDYTDSQDRQLKFDERQEIKRDENDEESSSSDE